MATKGKCCHFSLMNVTQNSSHNFYTLAGHFNVACKPDELKRRGGVFKEEILQFSYTNLLHRLNSEIQ